MTKKKNKVRLIYAYHRESGEIAAWNRRFAVWWKRNIKTAQKQRKRIKGPGISYDRTAADGRDGFLSAFREGNHAAGIEGGNCRLRRAFRRTCCFSKKLCSHWKAFETAFFYINYGFL
jgi:IS1 family transposase